MDAPFDLVIRGGTVFDGSGAAGRAADVAISAGRIAAIGRIAGSGREEIDARGRIVTPGFVDVHTHYDGQVTWEERLAPSTEHGVTTVVMGNCGVGFAPCRPGDHDRMIRLMQGVEDIPGAVLAEGIPWEWQSYPEYLRFLAARRYDADIASYVPHAALRVFVMGQRACDLEPATESDCAAMAALLREAMAEGALGFGTSRLLIHRDADGRHIPTYKAEAAEFFALAGALRDAGRGTIQMVTDWNVQAETFAFMRRLAADSGRPLTFTMSQRDGSGAWRDLLALVDDANAAGVVMRPQVLPRAVGMIYGHRLTLNPFFSAPSYVELRKLPFAELIAALRTPQIRARILAETLDPDPANRLGLKVRQFERIFELPPVPDYEPDPATCLAARAARAGCTPEELAYDLMLANAGNGMLYLTSVNYFDGSLEAVREMLGNPNVIPGLGDGGAHVSTICDAGYTSFMLAHWGRDRTRGPRMKLQDIVHGLTRKSALAVGLADRGLLAPGMRADVNVIDFDHLAVAAPHLEYTLPAGGQRLLQRVQGYDATILGGEITWREGQPTGALPGRLVRAA